MNIQKAEQYALETDSNIFIELYSGIGRVTFDDIKSEDGCMRIKSHYTRGHLINVLINADIILVDDIYRKPDNFWKSLNIVQSHPSRDIKVIGIDYPNNDEELPPIFDEHVTIDTPNNPKEYHKIY